MKNSKLEKYKNNAPEIVFEWHDQETGAEGWVVINSLKNGAAGGGTRMRAGLTKEEVISLSKVMEVKFTVAGPPIGGAKSGINFDPNHPKREEVLRKWYKAVFPLLKNYYGTGGDLNVDELRDVKPITEALGLWHPQEGIVNGHLHAHQGEAVHVLGQLRHGCEKIVENPEYVPQSNQKYAVADLVTGYGVSESVKHYYDIFRKENLVGKKVIIQGWGNVASSAALYLAYHGAVITGIIDRVGGIIAPEGLGRQEVEQLFLNKSNNTLDDPRMISFEKANEQIWDVPMDIFIPGAASKLVTPSQVSRMLKAGCECIACGANVPFVDDKVFFGATADLTDDKIALIPDFISNCGMARVFAYLMQPQIELSDEAIFKDVSKTIFDALQKVHLINDSGRNISSTSLEIALDKLL